MPLEIKERIRRFEIIREAYLQEQALLRKRLSGATTEEERERIRALIKQTRDAWLARARALREEARERLRELAGARAVQERDPRRGSRERPECSQAKGHRLTVLPNPTRENRLKPTQTSS